MSKVKFFEVLMERNASPQIHYYYIAEKMETVLKHAIKNTSRMINNNKLFHLRIDVEEIDESCARQYVVDIDEAKNKLTQKLDCIKLDHKNPPLWQKT